MDYRIKGLIDNGTIICGRILRENGMIRFVTVDSSEIENIPEKERAYATASMGRAIFAIDPNGEIHNFKGVDSHLQIFESAPAELVNAKSISYMPSKDGYTVIAIVFSGKVPEIRISGASPLEDIEIEAYVNEKLSGMGVKVPKIIYIKEMPQEFSIKYGLPIKIEGSMDDFETDYATEDNARKRRLAEIYGDSYVQELGRNQRPETMREYLDRIGFLTSKEVQENIKSLGYTMDSFVERVDHTYSRGQRYGQTERIIGSPFRISDLEVCIVNGDRAQLQTIMDFEKSKNSNFPEQLARDYGKNIAILMNNGWECENLMHRQDFSLTGEFCDDSYFDILEEKERLVKKHKEEPYRADAMWQEIKRRYVGQVMHVASCIKVLQEAMELTGENKARIDSILDKFVESFVSNLDFQSIGGLFSVDENTAREAIMNKFITGQGWTGRISAQDRPKGLAMDEAIYNANIGNEEFYCKVGEGICDRIKTIEEIKKGGITMDD